MAGRWVRFCRTADFEVAEPSIVVRFSDGRRQRVTVEDRADEYHLHSFVVRQAVVSSAPDLPVQVWQRNRATALVGFRIDQRGRLVGEAIVPKPGLSADEFRLYVRTLAAECDRFEYVLTGRDVE